MTLDRRPLSRTRRAPRRRALALARAGAVLALLAAACGTEAPAPPAGDGRTAGDGQAPAAAESGQPAGDSAAPAAADTAWTVGVREAPPDVQPAPPVPVVRAVRTGTHEGFDRVTIELEGPGIPGYHVEYVDKPLHQCGSGAEVFPVGQGWLEVRLEPAQAHTEEGAPTLSGREIEAAGRLLRRVYVICDFEGVVTLVLALDAPNRYQVSTLREPGRVVVDVRH